jgi:hypothetical protein
MKYLFMHLGFLVEFKLAAFYLILWTRIPSEKHLNIQFYLTGIKPTTLQKSRK